MLYHMNRLVTLSDIPNRHKLIYGNSGYGKTYCCCQLLEEEYSANRRTLVVDFSRSYDLHELQKSNLTVPHICWNPYHSPFYWSITTKSNSEFVNKIVDILLIVMKITSYYQRKLLLEAVTLHMKQFSSFNFDIFFKTLEYLYEQKKFLGASSDEISNMGHLINRFSPYRDLYNINLKPQKASVKTWSKQLFILQLSDFSYSLRKFLTLLFCELIWLETKNRESKLRFDTILLDEFHFLSLRHDSALTYLLREGRRFGIGLILSTQFISAYSPEELETLFQAGNILIFHPNERELNFSAKILNPFHSTEWIPLLNNLKVGQTILRGHYTLMSKQQILDTPILCDVISREEV